MEDEEKDGNREDSDDKGWDGHYFKILGKSHFKYGGKVDICRVSYLQKHREGIACDKLHDEVWERVEFALFCQMDDEWGEGQDNDVVRCEDRGHRDEKI